MGDTEKKWYVLRAIGGKEKKVKEYIDNEIARLKLQDYISQVLIPTEKVYQIRNGKKISKESKADNEYGIFYRAHGLCISIKWR